MLEAFLVKEVNKREKQSFICTHEQAQSRIFNWHWSDESNPQRTLPLDQSLNI